MEGAQNGLLSLRRSERAIVLVFWTNRPESGVGCRDPGQLDWWSCAGKRVLWILPLLRSGGTLNPSLRGGAGDAFMGATIYKNAAERESMNGRLRAETGRWVAPKDRESGPVRVPRAMSGTRRTPATSPEEQIRLYLLRVS